MICLWRIQPLSEAVRIVKCEATFLEEGVWGRTNDLFAGWQQMRLLLLRHTGEGGWWWVGVGLITNFQILSRKPVLKSDWLEKLFQKGFHQTEKIHAGA